MTEVDWEDKVWDMIYRQGKVKKAIIHLNEVINENPQDDQAYAIKANALNQLANDTKNWDHTIAALRCVDEALQINPNNGTALFNKAWSLVDLGRPTEAIKYADKALEINPNNVYAWYNKAWAHHLLHQIEEALTCCNKMIEIDPEFTEWAEKMKSRIKNREFPEHLSEFSRPSNVNQRKCS